MGFTSPPPEWPGDPLGGIGVRSSVAQDRGESLDSVQAGLEPADPMNGNRNSYRPSQQALEVLLSCLEEQARDRDDVRDALMELRAWIDQVVDSTGSQEDSSELREEILTPAPDRRDLSGPSPAGSRQDASDLEELALVVRRAKWKADVIRFVTDRRRGGEDLSRERILREEATTLPEISTRWLDSSRGLPDDGVLTEIADCYDLLARAAEVVIELAEKGALVPSPSSELLFLLAEIQSALLSALSLVEQRHDVDQRVLFGWLKGQTTLHRIYVDRHMRLDDPADASSSADRARRLERIRADLLVRRQRELGRDRLLSRARYHLEQARAHGSASEQDLHAVQEVAHEWCELGLPPGDPAIRGAVAAIVGDNTELGANPDVKRILAAEDVGVSEGRKSALAAVPELLAGRSAVVLASGPAADPSEETISSLRNALGLAQLEWRVFDQQDGVSGPIIEAIEAETPGLVLLGRKLPAEDYESFKGFCLEHDVPFVRLVQGFDPDRIAQQVLRQIGWRLRDSLTRS